ncbi:MAG: hypothetical protein KKH40_00670, partial [Nanoarchaeota archaeon]|nr:hypothetical protein [Nanoarchaeota archaeon]
MKFFANKNSSIEIELFLKLEDACREKVKLTNEFVKTWNEGDLKKLELHLNKIRPLIKKGEENIKKLRHKIAKKRNEETEKNTKEQINKLETLITHQQESLTTQQEFFKEKNLLRQKQKIKDLLSSIHNEASIIINEKEELELLRKEIDKIHIQKGMMTVNKFMEELQTEIMQNNLLEQIIELKKLKTIAEEYILKREINNPQLEQIRTIFSTNPETEIIKKLNKEKIKKIISLLENILLQERYKQTPNIKESFIFFHNIIKNLDMFEKLFTKQANALKRKNYSKFIQYYQKEKTEAHVIYDNLRKLNPETNFDDTIRAYKLLEKNYLKKKIERIFKKENIPLTLVMGSFSLIPGLASGFLYQNITISKVSLMSIVLFPIFTTLMGCILFYADSRDEQKEDVIYSYLSNLKKNKVKIINPNALAKAQELTQKYDFQVKGQYTYKDLIQLESVLKYYYPEEIKQSIKTIIYLSGTPKNYNTNGLIGQYGYYKKEIWLFSEYNITTIQHEIAHARTYYLPEKLITEWKIINKKGVDYE